MKKAYYKKGFTLVETLVYIAIFTVFFATIIQFSLSIEESNRIANLRKLLSNNSIYLVNHINDTFSKSQVIEESLSIFDSNSSKIYLRNGVTTFEYIKSQNQIVFKRSGVSSELNYDGVRLDRFVANKITDNSNDILGIRISATLVAGESNIISFSFDNLFYLQ